jgi:predicted RNase H-like HicB family nuclease
LVEEYSMHTVKIVYWEDDGWWLGYLQDYPDYMTQGKTLEDLKEHLKDLYHDISGGYIPGIRKVDELVVS